MSACCSARVPGAFPLAARASSVSFGGGLGILLLLPLLTGCDVRDFSRSLIEAAKSRDPNSAALQQDKAALTTRLNSIYKPTPPRVPKLRANLYEQRDFAAIEREIQTRLAQPRSAEGDSLLNDLYDDLSELRNDYSAERMLETLRTWSEMPRASHVPFLLRGLTLIDLAWKHRGGGWAHTVTANGWRNFHECLQSADQDLQIAAKRGPQDPNTYVAKITVAMGLGKSRAEMEMEFRKATKISPFHRDAHAAKQLFLAPKWHGTEDEYFEFLADQLELTKQEPWLVFSAAAGLNETYLMAQRRGGANPYENKRIWKVLDAAYRAAIAKYPHRKSLVMGYGVAAFRAKRLELAHENFELAGDQWEPISQMPELLGYNQMRVLALNHVGFGYGVAEEIEKAQKLFQEALRLDPNNAYTHAQLSLLFGKHRKSWDKCRHHAQLALANNPTKEIRESAEFSLQMANAALQVANN